MTEYENPACSTSQVLERARALAAIVTVLTMEFDYPGVAPAELQKFIATYDYLCRVYRSSPPTGVALSPKERAILETPLGAWSAADRLNVGWRTECAGVLGWAIGVIDVLAPYDQMIPYEWIQPLVSPDIQQRLLSPRTPEELDRALADAERWHWRARQAQGYFANPSVDTLTGKAADRRKHGLRQALGENAHLFGKPYEDLTFQEWSLAWSIASERHHALKWVWDGGPWDEVITDT